MRIYRYTAKSEDGTRSKGTISAQNDTEFFAALREKGLFCVEYSSREADRAAKRFKKLKIKELIIFCRKLGTMLTSGISITSALDILYQSADKPKVRDIFLDLFERIQTGVSLSEAMKQQNGSFPPFLISMVESGEESGSLDTILTRLAEHYEKENRLREKIKSAMAYPVILFSVSILVIIALFTFVLPTMFSVFEGMELPPLTKAMFAISDFFTHWWYVVIIGIVILAAVFAKANAIPGFNLVIGRLKLHFPVFGRMNQMLYSARFARSVSLLYTSGLPIVSTLSLSAGVLNNPYVSERFKVVVDSVMQGNTLAESLGKAGIFDNMLLSMIKVGEESGNLDSILEHTADFYENESDLAVQKMLTMLEPILLVILGVVIALILISVLVPMYTMYQTLL